MTKRYRTIVADPPWAYRVTALKQRTGRPAGGGDQSLGTAEIAA